MVHLCGTGAFVVVEYISRRSKGFSAARATSFAQFPEDGESDSSMSSGIICGGIATRYEYTARNFLAEPHLVCALAWIK
jgi:hypothetical protein